MKKVLLLFFITATLLRINAQGTGDFTVRVNERADMPEPVSNNAVVQGWANGIPYVYSFGGIDSTKIWSGIHLRSFRYNTISDVWDTIPSLPDTLGKIAAAASWVDSVIYIIGGYHVYANSSEASSGKVHRYDPRTNSYLSDGADIPLPIDDHVQAVWNDSLIYVITGWSNTNNAANVQIYDPANDNWLTGTPVPSNSIYKAFGATGSISGNTIYYHGGASSGFNFPVQSNIRIGQINPLDPTQITWSVASTVNQISSYRAISMNVWGANIFHCIGGAKKTYNYNGIAYNGSGGVEPSNTVIEYAPTSSNNQDTSVIVYYSNKKWLPMDLRGAGFFSSTLPNEYIYLAGGMGPNQKVSNRTIELFIDIIENVEEKNYEEFKLYPNPTSNLVHLSFNEKATKTIRIVDLLGNDILKQVSNKKEIDIDVSTYPKGIYFINVDSEKGSATQKIIVQ